ncbi:MAG: Hsp20/alpha crystallin family protein [Phycisphaeraceae bacterium]|nr:Hsp20/alpha crystallin family protein [Phycisphaeraceae bacterium]
MALSLWKHRDPSGNALSRLREEMDRTFDRFFTDPLDVLDPVLLRQNGWAPPLDISEADGGFIVRAEVPGIASKDLDVSVAGRTLTISGAKNERSEVKDEDFYQCERRFGSFRRSIELPEEADADTVSAEVDSGVLTVHVAKKPGVQRRQVPVEVKPATHKVGVSGRSRPAGKE